jgi:hypothetical protein
MVMRAKPAVKEKSEPHDFPGVSESGRTDPVEGENSSIHGWIYEIVSEICADRDYLYRVFYEHFTALLRQIYEEGRVTDHGDYLLPGLKSGSDGEVHWQLDKRLNYMGSNRLRLRCTLTAEGENREVREAEFELSTGLRIYREQTY